MGTPFEERRMNAKGRYRIGSPGGARRSEAGKGGGLREFYALQNWNLSTDDARNMSRDMQDQGVTLRPGQGGGAEIAPSNMSAFRQYRGGAGGGSGGRNPIRQRMRGQRRNQPQQSPAASNAPWTRANLGIPAAPTGTPLESARRPEDRTAEMRRRLQARAEEIRMAREQANPVTQSSSDAVDLGAPAYVLQSKYGTGSSTNFPAGKRPEATINGQRSSDFFKDAADRQGMDNKFARTSVMDPKKWREQLSRRGSSSPSRREV